MEREQTTNVKGQEGRRALIITALLSFSVFYHCERLFQFYFMIFLVQVLK